MRILHHPKGSISVSVLITLSILAALSASVLVFVAANQSARIKQFDKTQSFYTAQAGLEFTMRQILVGGNPNPIPIRYFLGQPLNISRTCGKINVTATSGSSTSSFSITDPGQVCATSSSATPNSASSTFNGQSISHGNWIWFNASISFTGAGTTLTHVYAKNSSVTFTANSVNYNIPIPDAIITLDPNASCVSTSYASSLWETTAPINYNKSVFLSGVGFQVPVDLPGSISPVVWTTTIASDQAGLSVKWIWGAAVYTTSLANLNSLGVKASDTSTCNNLISNDKVATPENVILFHTNGARCGAGNDFTCQGSGVNATVVSCISSC